MKKICVMTGTRAEYGLLKPLIKKIEDDRELELKIAHYPQVHIPVRRRILRIAVQQDYLFTSL